MKHLNVIKVKRIDNELITCEEITINDDLSDFYEHIGCSTIDIVVRRIGGVLFNIILDDEALLKDNPGMPTSWWQDGNDKEGLFGTLLLCHDDGEGNLTDVEPYDIFKVHEAFRYVKLTNGELLTLLFHEIR